MLLLFVSFFSAACTMALLWLCFMTHGPDSSMQRQTDKRIKTITSGLLIVSGVCFVLHSLAPDPDEYVQQVGTPVDPRVQAYVWCFMTVSAAFGILLLADEEDIEARPVYYYRRRNAARGG